MRVARLASFVLLAALWTGAPASAQAPVHADVDYQPPPGACVVPAPVCVVGVEDQGTASPSDDVYYATPVVRRADVAVDVPVPVVGAARVGFEDGRVLAPVALRSAALEAAEAIDRQLLGDRLATREEGPWVVWAELDASPAASALGRDNLTAPLIVPLLERDGIVVPVVTDLYGLDESLDRFAEPGCSLGYTLPPSVAPLFCVDLSLRFATEAVKATLPDVQFASGVEEGGVSLGTPAAATLLAVGGVAGAAVPSPSGSQGLPDWVRAVSHPSLAPAGEAWAPARDLRGGATEQGETQGLAAMLAPVSPPFDAAVLAAAALAGLLAYPLLRLYRRLNLETCLQQDLRSRILREVRRSPGVQPAQLAASLGCSFKTVTHHAEILREFGVLDVERRSHALHLFERGLHSRLEKALLLSRGETRARVLRLVAAKPGVHGSVLARELGLGRPGLHSHLQALHRDGLVVRAGRQWFVAEEAASRLGLLGNGAQGP